MLLQFLAIISCYFLFSLFVGVGVVVCCCVLLCVVVVVVILYVCLFGFVHANVL